MVGDGWIWHVGMNQTAELNVKQGGWASTIAKLEKNTIRMGRIACDMASIRRQDVKALEFWVWLPIWRA